MNSNAAGRTVTLEQEPKLTLADIEDVAFGRAKVALAARARDRLAAFRAAAERQIAANPDKRVYGLNTGFGSNYRDYVSPEDLKRLQRNLIISHCAGVGAYAPASVSRATTLLRAASLARGHSVVRPVVVETLIAMLNEGVTPAIPRLGSVSASGDLAPLSHVAAVVIGEGRVLNERGEGVATQHYLTSAKTAFAPIELEMKEGLALNNGCQYTNAWGALAAAQMRRLIDAAALATAMHVQALRGAGRPFRADLHALRAHPGSQILARWIFELLDGYGLQNVSTDVKFAYDGRIQDPYNLRCAAQVLGPCLDLIARAEATMAAEARSVTDNPIDLNTSAESYDLDEITSGGHFHGMPVAVDAYGLLQAAGIMARISNLRCARIVDQGRNKGLGPQMRGPKPSPAQSGLMIAEYTTAGLCNHIWGLAMPSHLMSLSTDAGQEDHVSMGANVAIRAHEAGEHLARILAIEMAFASQAEHVRANNPEEKPIALGARVQRALDKVRESFPLVGEDRELSWDIETLAEKVLSGEIAKATGYSFGRH
jgi:histidine ammonia-lyase